METYYPDYNIDLSDFPSGLPGEVMDTLNPKKHRRTVLVEDCFVLTLSDLGKKLLRPVNEWKENYPQPLDQQVELLGKRGEVTIVGRRGKLSVDYEVDLEDPPILNLEYSFRNSWHNQAVDLGEASVTFGVRPYLVCPCGHRANKLYLSPKQSTFMCRDCCGAYYESTTINRSSAAGGLDYLLAQVLKLDEHRAKIKRLAYAGSPTRKTVQLARKIGKYSGLMAVQKAKENGLLA